METALIVVMIIFIIFLISCIFLSIYFFDEMGGITIPLGILFLILIIALYTTPYQETVYFETDYNISEMITDSKYKVKVGELSPTENTDYVMLREYIFGRKRLLLKTNDIVKYNIYTDNFEKYKK